MIKIDVELDEYEYDSLLDSIQDSIVNCLSAKLNKNNTPSHNLWLDGRINYLKELKEKVIKNSHKTN